MRRQRRWSSQAQVSARSRRSWSGRAPVSTLGSAVGARPGRRRSRCELRGGAARRFRCPPETTSCASRMPSSAMSSSPRRCWRACGSPSRARQCASLRRSTPRMRRARGRRLSRGAMSRIPEPPRTRSSSRVSTAAPSAATRRRSTGPSSRRRRMSCATGASSTCQWRFRTGRSRSSRAARSGGVLVRRRGCWSSTTGCVAGSSANRVRRCCRPGTALR